MLGESGGKTIGIISGTHLVSLLAGSLSSPFFLVGSFGSVGVDARSSSIGTVSLFQVSSGVAATCLIHRRRVSAGIVFIV